MSLAVLTVGCSATERLWVERSEPARVDLPADADRLAVASFEGESGAALSAAIVVELEQGAGPRPVSVEPLPQSIQDALALLAADDLRALLAGRVEAIDTPDPQSDDPGMIRVRYHVVLRDGSVLPAPLLAITLPAEERGEGTWEEALLARAARDLVAGLRPRSVKIPVEWELAGGWDEEAWERFASGDYRQAAELLDVAIRKAQDLSTDGETLGALYYDLALCQELLGDLQAADRNYDEALTLSGTELHITSLRALRVRVERTVGGR